MGWIVRRRYVIAAVTAAALAGVTLVAMLTPKHWQSTTTVAVEPLQVAGLRSPGADVPSRAAAIDAEVAVAEGDPFRSAALEGFDYPVTYRVTGDANAGTLQFAVRSDSADRAYDAGYSIANMYIAWGRAMEPTGSVAELQSQIEATRRGEPAQDGVSLEQLQAEITVRQAALAQLSAGGGTVTVPPGIPDDPVAPRLVYWLAIALVGGLEVGLVAARWVDERSTSPGVGPAVSGPALSGRVRLGRVIVGAVAVMLPLAVVASLFAGVIGVWEMRPTTAAIDEQKYACLERWVDLIPDGKTLAVEAGDAFFRDRFQEFAFPRLGIADEDHDADAVLQIVAGPGPKECGGYHLESPP